MPPKSLLALALLAILMLFSHGVTTLGSPQPLNGTGGSFSLKLIVNHQPAHYDLASLQRAKDQVKCRIKHQILPTSNEIRPFMCPPADMVYAVMVGVGTQTGFQNYQLALDMAVGLSWIQCWPCRPCRPQLSPVFDPTKSPTFQYISGNNGVWCRAPYRALPNGACGFRIAYRHTPEVSGYLARDTFSFPTRNNDFVPLEGIFFGCAHQTEGFDTHGALAGLLGLGIGVVGRPPTAFTKQVLPGHGGRFSYCPFVPGMSTYSYFRFGNDIPSNPPPNVSRQSTPVLAPLQNSEAYYIQLVGVSVGGSRVTRVTHHFFRRNAHGTGGCAIDIGTQMTAFVHSAYVYIEEAVLQHLRRHGAHIVQVEGHTCVRQPAPHQDVLPSMTLHFVNRSWLRIMPDQVFVKLVHGGHQYRCLGFVSDSDRTIIGAMQQINHRFIFDLRDTTPIMSFNPEDCHLDAAVFMGRDVLVQGLIRHIGDGRPCMNMFSKAPQATHNFIMKYVRELKDCKPKKTTVALEPRRQGRPRWIPPPLGMAKIRVDGAVARDLNEGTFSAVFRDSAGTYMGSSVIRTRGISDPATLEAVACREALALATDLALSHVLVASDCQGVIHDIKNNTGGVYASIIKEILETSRNFQHCSFIFEGRESNFEAHSLAKHTFGL
ncbi:Aspartic proteinase nepenthesin-2 [Triticum urartu]|uniref:Aspartic proteinase nepenthesin-2 n=2 Tax=Triticum urartu TaxID=4572 RepID=M7ZIM1_TRIUA|nr:Aspartic proteinase nepenthesin-2 [Triticum urartu]